MSSIITGSEIIYNRFVSKLGNVYKREAVYYLTKNLLWFFISIVALFIVLLILEAVYNFSSSLRTSIFYFSLSAFITTGLMIVGEFLFKILRILKSFNPIEYSAKVGNKIPDVKDVLCNTLSIYEKSRSEKIFSEDLIKADLELADKKFAQRNLGSFIKFSSLRKQIYILAGVLVTIVTLFIIFPSQLSGALNRYINHGFEFLPENLGVRFNLSPGNIEIPKGDNVTVNIFVTSNDPEFEFDNIDLYVFDLTKDGMELLREKAECERVSGNNFRFEIKNITGTLSYYADFKGVKSDKYTITVSENPIVKKFNIALYPPAITGIPSRELAENIGDVTVPEGSKVYFKLESNKELKEAGIKINDEIFYFEVNSRFAEGSVDVSVSTEYTFHLKDIDGNGIKNPRKYKLTIIEDEPPTVTIIEPDETYHIINSAREILIRGRITDDYGFSRLTLNYRKTLLNTSAGGKFTVANIPVKNLNAKILEVPYMWNFSNTLPGKNEQIEYYLEVTDNTGKSSRSGSKFLQYKSISELLQTTEWKTREIQADLLSISQDASELQKLMTESKRLNKTNEELGLNDPQRRRQIQESIENLQNTLNNTQQKINEALDNLEKRSLLNEKTLKDYMKMQELFNKINTPELQELLEKLREALKNNDPDKARDLMQQFNFDEEQFRKNLEKVMEIMKKIENLQKFGELTQKLDEITSKQEELLDETRLTNEKDKQNHEELSNRQDMLKDDLSDFKEGLKELIDEMRKMENEMNPDDLEKLLKQLQQMKTDQKMMQSSEQLQQNQKESSEQTQQEIMDDLDKLNQDMQDALESAMQMQNSGGKMMQKLNEIKQNIEKLSKDQQHLKEKTGETQENNKADMQSRSTEQQQLQQRLSENINELLNNAGDMVSPELGKELGDAYNEMGEAGDNIKRGDKSGATEQQGEAKESLDNAAKMLGDMISQLQQQGKNGKNGKGSKGRMGQLMQQLAEIIAQQQGLAGQMNQLSQNGKSGQNGQQGQLTQQQMQQLDRLKLEQQKLSEQLGNLNKEFEEERKMSGEKLLGNLNEIQKQMQEVVSELEDYDISKETIERQNKIISRMLDAQLSQREKDFEQRRESNPGKNFVRISPPEIVIQGPNSFNAFKEDFLKIKSEGYNRDYEELIIRYLNELRKQGYFSE